MCARIYSAEDVKDSLRKLAIAETDLKNYSNFSSSNKISRYSCEMKNALENLFLAVKKLRDFKYAKDRELTFAYQLTNANIIPFTNSVGHSDMIRQRNAVQLEYPTGSYQEINKKSGQYEVNGEPLYSSRLAVDYSLNNMCETWLNEIPILEERISKLKTY